MAIGTIKRLVREKGFGFIRDSRGQEYFFHKSETYDFDAMSEGDKVHFEATTSTKGPRAINVAEIPNES